MDWYNHHHRHSGIDFHTPANIHYGRAATVVNNCSVTLAAGSPTLSLAAHPGQSRTNFTRGLGAFGRFMYGPRARFLTGLVMQDKSIGVLAGARATTDPTAKGGGYYGPAGPSQLTGYPVVVGSNAQSRDRSVQDRLWAASEQATGIAYPLTTTSL